MDKQLQQLKRRVAHNPGDVELLHRYIAALERATVDQQDWLLWS